MNIHVYIQVNVGAAIVAITFGTNDQEAAKYDCLCALSEENKGGRPPSPT